MGSRAPSLGRHVGLPPITPGCKASPQQVRELPFDRVGPAALETFDASQAHQVRARENVEDRARRGPSTKPLSRSHAHAYSAPAAIRSALVAGAWMPTALVTSPQQVTGPPRRSAQANCLPATM